MKTLSAGSGLAVGIREVDMEFNAVSFFVGCVVGLFAPEAVFFCVCRVMNRSLAKQARADQNLHFQVAPEGCLKCLGKQNRNDHDLGFYSACSFAEDPLTPCAYEAGPRGACGITAANRRLR